MTTTGWVFASTYVVLPTEDIDTDQIIPARFLTTTRRDGLGPLAFHDRRYDEAGLPDPAFPLNRPEAVGAEVLVAGRNFGCGSSREHAVWALRGVGFRAVVSSGFADIFRANALGNGLLPVDVAPDVLAALMAPDRPADARVRVDLDGGTLGLPDGGSVAFRVPPFARHCLLHGIDEMQFLLGTLDDVTAYEARQGAKLDTTRVWREVRPAAAGIAGDHAG
jgi:3-isopropylmalate/(R)-2-methylmalate dehydratase small subunit